MYRFDPRALGWSDKFTSHKRFYKLYKSATGLDVVLKHQKNSEKLWLLSIVDIDYAIKYYKSISEIDVPYRKNAFGMMWLFNQKFRNCAKRKISAMRKRLPLNRIKMNMRTRVSSYCKKIQVDKNFKTMDALGCTSQEFKQHLESKFTEGMSWDNYPKWHVDHIKPISLATTEQEAIELSHYTNLQPLWAADNLSKGNKYD